MIKFTVKPLTDEYVPRLSSILSKIDTRKIITNFMGADTLDISLEKKVLYAFINSLPVILASVPEAYSEFRALVLDLVDTEEDTTEIKAGDFMRLCAAVCKSEDFVDFFRAVLEFLTIAKTAGKELEHSSQSSTDTTATPEA